MTHGELRGLLVLLGLMVLVVVYAWVFKKGAPSDLPEKPEWEAFEQVGDSVPAGLRLSRTDSLVNDVAAREAAYNDSVRRAKRETEGRKKDSKKAGGKTPKKGKRTTPPTPSPLDRPL